MTFTLTHVAERTRTIPAASFRFSPEQIELLRRAFPGLDDASLASLAGMTRESVIPAGVTLCTEGRLEDTFYVISSGRVLVSQCIEKDTSRILAYRGAGEFIGELSLLIEDQSSTTDVVTLEKTTVLEIERTAFQQLLQRSPSIVLAVLRALADRQRESDQQMIADLRQKYAELAEAYRRLKDETNRRSEFLTTVAHELRTPLTVVKGYLALIRTGAFGGEAKAQAVKTITANFDTIMRLVNNILLLQETALIAPQFQLISINSILDHLGHTLKSSASLPDGLTIRAEVAAGLPWVQGDPAGLMHAFGAILDNAIKFSPDGGEIVLRAYAQDGRISVQVRDPGVGIAREELPRIFDHFHHLDSTSGHMFGGIGLGLPLAKAVIEQHHGVINVESELGKGSTFTITLPVT